jgi:hypothetical protein
MSQQEVAAWLREAAQAFRVHFGMRRHLCVVIQDAEDPAAAVVFSVPPESLKDQVIGLPSAGRSDARLDARLNEAEGAIVEVLKRHGILTGPQLAALAGYPYDGYLRSILASLRRRGVIGNKSPGYHLS